MSDSASDSFPFGLKRNGTKKSLLCSPVPVQVVTRKPPQLTNCLESSCARSHGQATLAKVKEVWRIALGDVARKGDLLALVPQNSM